MPSIEAYSSNEYPSNDEGGQLLANTRTTSVFVDTVLTLSSSSTSQDIVILSSKLPLITISGDFEEPSNSKLVEVPDDSEGSSDDSDF